MTNQDNSIQQLEEISKGTNQPTTDQKTKEVFLIEGLKISNRFLQILISHLEKENVDPKEALKLIKNLDELVEKREIDNNTLLEYLNK